MPARDIVSRKAKELSRQKTGTWSRKQARVSTGNRQRLDQEMAKGLVQVAGRNLVHKQARVNTGRKQRCGQKMTKISLEAAGRNIRLRASVK